MSRKYVSPTLESITAQAIVLLGHRLDIRAPDDLDPDTLAIGDHHCNVWIYVVRSSDTGFATLSVTEFDLCGNGHRTTQKHPYPMPLAELEPAIWQAVLEHFGSPDDTPVVDEEDVP